MSNSGSGRWAHFSVPAGEPMQDPWEAAALELRARLPYLRDPDIANIMQAVHEAGLTFCWEVPGDE